MATCKGCIHHAVCKVHGEVIKTRIDVERICEHFEKRNQDDALEVIKDMKSEFDRFWKDYLAKK